MPPPRTFSSLPEDILYEILSICLTPPDFLGEDRGHYYWGTDHTRSQLLLVSRKWHRVGTPLLYKYLLIRTQRDTKTIVQVFLSNPRLGLAVRNLRLEGGMGKELRQVVSHCPNIQSFFISCSELKAADSIAGIRSVLPIMSVEHLYYRRTRWRKPNKTERELQKVVQGAITEAWTSIKSVTFADSTFLSSPLDDTMIKSLQSPPCLQQLSICDSELKVMLHQGRFGTLTKISSLTSIRCLGNSDEDQIRRKFVEKHIPTQLSGIVSFVRTGNDGDFFSDDFEQDSEAPDEVGA